MIIVLQFEIFFLNFSVIIQHVLPDKVKHCICLCEKNKKFWYAGHTDAEFYIKPYFFHARATIKKKDIYKMNIGISWPMYKQLCVIFLRDSSNS